MLSWRLRKLDRKNIQKGNDLIRFHDTNNEDYAKREEEEILKAFRKCDKAFLKYN